MTKKKTSTANPYDVAQRIVGDPFRAVLRAGDESGDLRDELLFKLTPASAELRAALVAEQLR